MRLATADVSFVILDLGMRALLSSCLVADYMCHALTCIPGRLWAAGRAALAAQWFATLGFTMPYGVNVADFILDVASGALL